MKKVLILFVMAAFLLSACGRSPQSRGLYVKKHSKKCGTCPVW